MTRRPGVPARRSVANLAALVRCLRQSNHENNSRFLLERTAQRAGEALGTQIVDGEPPVDVLHARQNKLSFKAQLQRDGATEAPLCSLARAPIAPLDTSP